MTRDSKKRKLSKWSVWCGYGLLAALLVAGGLWLRWAGRNVQNNAIEKSMLGEARMICSAVHQLMEETHRDTIGFSEIAVYFPDGRTGSGMEVSADGAVFTGGDYRKTTGMLRKDGYFYVRHAQWSRSRSSSRWITDASAPDEHTMKFQVKTGQVAGEFSGL